MPAVEPARDSGATQPPVDATDLSHGEGVESDPAPLHEMPSVDDAVGSQPNAPTGSGHPLLWYTLARIGLLVVVGAILYVVGARGILWLLLAFLISGLLSFVVLGPLRDALSARLSARVDRSRAKKAEKSAAEDELL